ncbi:uncharacterized protein LOC126909217 [Daktulosphaira vitifoliae]|uniref:uncharacterized protein LOC126909217 n=1 Tax=Daktulosphaira vitifoliae TaxID=58002 RepID=UPI0021A9EACE|nr:uncharacterized protein LOC126909217 [Daktulosphaira vitifoliae]
MNSILNPNKYGPGIKGIIRQGMHEIPLIMLGAPFAIFGSGLILWQTYKYHKNDGVNRKYKLKYTLYRPDDPRVKFIRD